MIIAQHPEDKRIVLMAKEHNLKPMVKSSEGKWGVSHITGRELSDFIRIQDNNLRLSILEDALGFAELNPQFKIK